MMSWKVWLEEEMLLRAGNPAQDVSLYTGHVAGQAKDLDTGYTLKAPALTGAFYFFNSLTKSHKSAFNTWH